MLLLTSIPEKENNGSKRLSSTPSVSNNSEKIACVAGVKRERGRLNLGARERVGVVSRPNSLPLPFRTPATQASEKTVYSTTQKTAINRPMDNTGEA